MNWLLTLIEGQEKALVGGAVSAVLSLLAQVGVNGDMSVRDALTALGVGLATHALVYLKRNS